jgi:Pectate lyase superfamily protein
MSTQLTKRALFSKGALSAGVGLGTLASFAQCASADTPFTAFAFPATGAPTPRTMPDRLAEVINVKDFGAVGDGVNNDGPALQDAFDAAFGSGSGSHGTSSYLNRAVHIPYGAYLIGQTLNLTDVQGGYIFGDGFYATNIIASGGVNPLFNINGMSYSRIEALNCGVGAKSSNNGRCAVYLDWDGTGNVGLHDNTFFDVGMGGGNYGIRIAPSNNGGGNIVFIKCQVAGSGVGMSIEGHACTVTALAGACSESYTGVWVQKGSFVCGFQFAGGGTAPEGTGGQTDIVHDSTGITSVYGTRSESARFCDVTNGKLIAIGLLYQIGPNYTTYAVNCRSPASVNLVSCVLGDASSPSGGYITGSGDVYLKNVIFANNPPIYLSSFTGKICQYAGADVFTYAQLPPAAEGLILNLSNANANTWGVNVTGTGSNHVMVRWNGSNWTVIGI